MNMFLNIFLIEIFSIHVTKKYNHHLTIKHEVAGKSVIFPESFLHGSTEVAQTSQITSLADWCVWLLMENEISQFLAVASDVLPSPPQQAGPNEPTHTKHGPSIEIAMHHALCTFYDRHTFCEPGWTVFRADMLLLKRTQCSQHV